MFRTRYSSFPPFKGHLNSVPFSIVNSLAKPNLSMQCIRRSSTVTQNNATWGTFQSQVWLSGFAMWFGLHSLRTEPGWGRSSSTGCTRDMIIQFELIWLHSGDAEEAVFYQCFFFLTTQIYFKNLGHIIMKITKNDTNNTWRTMLSAAAIKVMSWFSWRL